LNSVLAICFSVLEEFPEESATPITQEQPLLLEPTDHVSIPSTQEELHLQTVPNVKEHILTSSTMEEEEEPQWLEPGISSSVKEHTPTPSILEKVQLLLSPLREQPSSLETSIPSEASSTSSILERVQSLLAVSEPASPSARLQDLMVTTYIEEVLSPEPGT
jgi:hypothetical protein